MCKQSLDDKIKAHLDRVRMYNAGESSAKDDIERGMDIYYHEGIDRLIYLTYHRAYHEEEGSWVFLTSNPAGLKTSGQLIKIKRYLI